MSGKTMGQYVKEVIPPKAEIDFIFKEDFDGDGSAEAVIGYTLWDKYPYEFTVIWVKRAGNGYVQKLLLTTVENTNSLYDANDEIYGVCDGAFAVDTDGDDRAELVVGMTVGNGHFVTGYLVDWDKGLPVLTWRSPKSYGHGLIEVVDQDRDGIYEIALEESTDYGRDIYSMAEADPHVRRRTLFKWDGKSYVGKPGRPGEERYLRYNTAAIFLRSIWREDYRKAYSLVQLPVFMGPPGIDDSSVEAFRHFAEDNIRPQLVENIRMGRLQPMGDDWFRGQKSDIYVTTGKEKGQVKVVGVDFVTST